MNDEANRLLAEALGETDHLRKWCGDDEGELCLEEPNQEQPRSSCSHLANGGTWETCRFKRTVALQEADRLQTALAEARAENKRLRDALSHTRKVLTSNQPETLATWPGRRMTEAVAIIDKALKEGAK